MGLRPLSSQKRMDYVLEQIVQAIARGDFPIGQRLPPERELATLLNVGRSSVREALIMLQVAGVLEVRHGSGIYVRALPDPQFLSCPFFDTSASWDDNFQTISEARFALGQSIVQLAAANRIEEGLERMRQALEDMSRSVEKEDVELFIDSNLRFHEGLAKAAGNPILEYIYNQTIAGRSTDEVNRVLRLVYEAEPDKLARTFRLHQAIYQAVSQGNRRDALIEIRRHYSNVASRFIGEEGDASPLTESGEDLAS